MGVETLNDCTIHCTIILVLFTGRSRLIRALAENGFGREARIGYVWYEDQLYTVDHWLSHECQQMSLQFGVDKPN